MTTSSWPPAPPAGSLWRRLVDEAVSPAVFDFWVGQLNPAWSWQRPLARVTARRVEALGAVTLVLRPNRHWRETGGFQPGQHVNLTAEVHGRRVTRSYSLSDASRRDGQLAITVKQIEAGRLSEHLCRSTRVGDVLELSPAFGSMTWPAHATGRWAFLAAGSGITPLMSLVRAFPAGVESVTLVYWARTRAELCFAQELEQLAAREPRFTLHLMLTREPGDAAAGVPSGRRLDAAMLRDLGLLDDVGLLALACGPGDFVQTARALLEGRVQSFQAEAFTPHATPPVLSGTVPVRLAASGRTLDVPVGMPLLTALEAQGVHPPSGCRMGICHTCVCPKLSGSTQDLCTGASSDQPDSALRLCVSTARSPLTLDL